MFSAIRRRIHLTPSTVIATLALVLAMSGGAYAASKYVITSTKQISPKVLKSLKGANGKNGAAGPAGPAGAAGAGTAGAAGPQGPAGPGGAAGTAGTNGTNGKDGKNGTTGFTETLPSKKTETGTWAFGPLPAETNQIAVASFPIPLSKSLDGSHVHLINSSGEELHFEKPATAPTECGSPVGTVLEPKAEPGNLCVYIASLSEAAGFSEGIVNPEGARGAGATGALLTVAGLPAEHLESGHGTWAVTAP
jgi:hypothetical protein